MHRLNTNNQIPQQQQQQILERNNIYYQFQASEVLLPKTNSAKILFESMPNWPQNHKYRDSQISYRLGYLLLAEVTHVALKKTHITFNSICDKFGIHYQTNDYIKALFGYTLDRFPFQQNYEAFISDLTKYLQPQNYHNSYLSKGYFKKNLKRHEGKVRFNSIFQQMILQWKGHGPVNVGLLDYVRLRPGLTLRKYLGFNPNLSQVLTTIDEMSRYI